MNLTAACCVTLTSDANHLAMCLGESAADAQTYGHAGWQDAQGNLYVAVCFLRQSMAQDPMTGPVQRPVWDVTEQIDMEAAWRAQAAMVVWDGESEPPQATPGTITVMGGPEGLAALAAMGLSAVPSEAE